MLLGEIIKKYRTEFQLSLRDFSKRTGLSYTYISALEKNKDYRTGKPISPTLETVRDVAKGMNMSVDDLLKVLDDEQELTINEDNNPKDIFDNIFIIPVVGRIPAGSPLLAEENIEGYLPIDPIIYHLTSPENLFYLKVVGNSMNNVIKDGGYALIKQQDYAETGDIVVAVINGDNEATLKRFKDLDNGFVMLEPDSTYEEYQPLIINLRDTEFKILGKLVGIHQVWA
jgi:repressor LexA